MFGLDDIKRGILQKGRELIGAAWKPAWRSVAQRVYDLEKTFKEGTGIAWDKGHVRKDIVLKALRDRLDPLLAKYPDFAERLFWEAIEHVLDKYIQNLDETLGKDWVLKVEDFESQVAYPLETLLDMDLDGDGLKGAPPPAVAALVVLALLALASAGPADALGKKPPLIPHYGEGLVTEFDEKGAPAPAEAPVVTEAPVSSTTATVAPVSPGKRPPLIPHYQPKDGGRSARREGGRNETGLPSDVGLETWFGHQPARGGIDTGIGAVVRRGKGAVGAQLAVDRFGICAGYWRVGVNYLWNPRDGSRELGAYIVPVKF